MASSPESNPPPAPNPGPDVERPTPGPGDPASRAIVASLATAMGRIQAAEASARAGEPEGVHRLRTSSRRLRSELQAFGRLVSKDDARRLTEELKWIGQAIGKVRDLDVLRARLEVGESEADKQVLKPLFDRLEGRHAEASQEMRRTLLGDRFRSLLTTLEKSLESPPLGGKAEKSCRKVLPPLVAKAWKRLRRDAKGLSADTPDPVFHEVRKRAKQARYTTELVGPTLGRDARKATRRLTTLARTIQDVLGEHQDAVVAIDEVEAMLGEEDWPPEFRRAAADLLVRLRRAADESRDRFLDELSTRLGKKKNRGGLTADG